MKYYAFVIAILLYALLSSPTADEITWVEISVAGLLLSSIGIAGGWNALTQPIHANTLQYHRLFFCYMMIIPMGLAILYGQQANDIIRDIIPILFLILPLWIYQNNFKNLDIILAVAGGVFAFRYCASYLPVPFFDFQKSHLLYLANSPLIPFAAIIGFAWISDTQKTLFSKRLIGILLFLMCFGAMALTIQRAPIILSAMACLIILGLRSIHRPIHSMVIGAIIMGVLIPVIPIVIDLIQSMIDKTLSVGLNNRIEEFQSVITQSSVFGKGWGALWQSPAVGDMWVRYTHNMVSYYWLKAGIVGACLSLIFIVIWSVYICKIIKHNPSIGLAIFVPFIIHVTLYTGFKTLDFALLLSLAVIHHARTQQTINPDH